MRNAFELLDDLISEMIRDGHDRDDIISALELKLMALKEEEAGEDDDDEAA